MRNLLRAAGVLGFLTLLGSSLLVWSARWFWFGEIAASFAWQLGLIGSVGAILLLVIRCPRMALGAAILAFLQLWPELSLWLPHGGSGEVEERGEVLTIASSNLFWFNDDQPGVTEWLETVGPDIVVFLEVSLSWRGILERMGDEYPHLLLSPDGPWDDKTWGTAILSKRPVSAERLIRVPRAMDCPPMEIRIELGGEPLIIRGLHPMYPGRPWRTEIRDELLETVAELDWSGNSMLLGDLNTTSTSPSFGRLLQTSGLRDSRQGFGRQPTYITDDRIHGLEIAIDHILVSDSIHVLERWTEALPGSDHRTVVARVMLR
jgi:endonuclease/exonuclease/phosphatase (EEP) superfamily protein YafD